MVKRRAILKWTFTTLWIIVGAGVLTLLVAAIQKEEGEKCAGVNIIIKGVSNNFFVDKNDILNELNQYIDGSPEGQPMSFFNLKSLEKDLQKNIWVKKSQLFFDNNRVLQIIVTEREPAARVFTTTGTTFYIDSSITMLPLSEKFSARLPVFSGFPSDKAVLSKKDSALLRDVYNISTAIQQDSFVMALVEQVDITPQRTFEMVPKIGDAVITFGDGTDIEKKLSKLKLFYGQVIPQSGWDYYGNIDIQYAGQVVAKRKGAEDKTIDSLRTLQIMQMIAQTAENLANDSLQLILQDNERNTTSTNLVEQSLQRDDEPEINNEAPVVKIIDQSMGGGVLTSNPALTDPVPMKNTLPANKKVVAQPADKKTTVSKTVVKPPVKPVIKKPAAKPAVQKPAAKKTMPAINKSKPVPLKAISDKPKAVMQKPKTNDY